MKFSVVLIARNESKTLPRLMESLGEFMKRGGEVILVDTGSIDGTPETARSLGCKVFEEGNRFRRTISKKQAYDINALLDKSEGEIVKEGDTLFDYSAARNYAAMLAQNDVVAMPDCDEIYTKLDLDHINKAIEEGVDQLEYNFVFAHDEEGGELIKFLHSKFYNRKKLFWKGIIHEVLSPIWKDQPPQRQFLSEELIKLEHWQNPETNRGGYLKGLGLSVILDPEDDRNAHYFGRELLYAGRPKSAIKQLDRHVAMKRWLEERCQSLVHKGEALMMLGKIPEAVHTWLDAFDLCKTRREPLMKIAEYYYQAGSPEHTIAYATAALTIPRNNFYAAFQPYYEHLPHEMLYWAYWQKGQKELSRVHFYQAINLQPFNPKYLSAIQFYEELPSVSIIIPTLRPEGLERLLKSIEVLNYPKDKIETITLPDEPRIGVAKRVAEGVKKATGTLMVYAADDMEFEPNTLIAALQEMRIAGKQFCAFNSGPLSPDKGNICEHFIIHKDLVAELGGIFDTDFHHVGVDNLLWARIEKKGQALRSKHAKVKHHHFSQGAEMDDVHRIGWEAARVEEDRALLNKKLAEI